MNDFYSITQALEEYFDFPLCDLPDDVRQRVIQDLSPLHWDDLSSEERRIATNLWDSQHDPAMEEDEQAWFDISVSMDELKLKITEWEAVATPTANDLLQKENHLAELNEKLINMEQQVQSGNLLYRSKLEEPHKRKQRLESLFQEECRLRGEHGALQRTAERENISRQTLSAILNR